MKRRRKNIYFDRKSMGFKLGKKPQSRAEKKRQTAIKKQEKREQQLADREAKKQQKKQQSALFKQLRGDSKPQRKPRSRKPRWTSEDEQGWQELLRSNPAAQSEVRQFPGNLTEQQILALRKLVRQKYMATKRRKKKKNPKKGKMPAGLRKYWAKKRAKKRNPKKRRRVRKPRAIRRRRRAMNPRPRRRVRRMRRNPPRARRPKIVKAPAGMSPQAYAKLLRKAGVRARVINR